LNEIFEIADEVTVLKDGKAVGTARVGEITRSQLIQMMVGRPLEEVFPRGRYQAGEPLLEVNNLSVRGRVHDVSFVLHAGEITGLAGMVGSGRTELARALFGADHRDGGTVRLKRAKMRSRHTPQQAIQAGLALVPEDRKTQGLLVEQSIRKNITLPILHRLRNLGFIRRAQELDIVQRARERLAIQMNSPEQQVRYLSGGNQQKVVLAKWLETEPAVIILDEPTRGIDVGAKFEIYQLMRDLTDRGVAILMISSELPEILGMSDRILVMQNGEIVAELGRDEASEERIVELATTGRMLEGMG
jgi:ribose transport system ATP-binding protein